MIKSVLMRIGWIEVGGRKKYVIHIIDSVLVALFAVVGDGMAPFRAVDTYHMIFIAHYHRLTWRKRRQARLPKLQDKNDLPAGPRDPSPSQLEDGEPVKEDEFSVLTEAQQAKLVHHQKKFSRSHTFYKPHETPTHHAFPLHLLITVVVLLDCHSLLQISLGACTWAIDYHTRPVAITTVILCMSITVNITAGILISVGDRKTRKQEVLEIIKMQELTSEAMEMLERKREKEHLPLPPALPSGVDGGSSAGGLAPLVEESTHGSEHGSKASTHVSAKHGHEWAHNLAHKRFGRRAGAEGVDAEKERGAEGVVAKDFAVSKA